MQRFDYSWVTEPPISFSEGDQAGAKAERHVKEIKASIEDYWEDLIAPEEMHSLSDANFNNALDMCTEFGRYSVGEGQIYCAYKLGKNPAAMMIFELQEDLAFIRKLLVHPAAEFGGSIMVEYAVNFAVKNGIRPFVALTALNDFAAQSYWGMGFVDPVEGESRMELDLTTWKEKWRNLSGRWRYFSSRNPGPQYLKSAPKLPSRARSRLYTGKHFS